MPYPLWVLPREPKDRALDKDSLRVALLWASGGVDICNRDGPSCASLAVSWPHRWTDVSRPRSTVSTERLIERQKQRILLFSKYTYTCTPLITPLALIIPGTESQKAQNNDLVREQSASVSLRIVIVIECGKQVVLAKGWNATQKYLLLCLQTIRRMALCSNFPLCASDRWVK